MRALLRGHLVHSIEDIVSDTGFDIVEDGASADICICFGGDGTLLGAERDFPGVPKLPLRQRPKQSKEDARATYRSLLERVFAGEGARTFLPKLQAKWGQKKLCAINDIIVHNQIITSAVRYVVEIDGVEHFGEIVGDGLVVSTPFGSAAYYRSITNSVIHVGIGLAFNNSTEPVTHLVLHEDSKILVRITRGPALLAADNSPDQFNLEAEDRIEIEMANEQAEILEIENLLCMDRRETNLERRLRWIKPLTQKSREDNQVG